VTNFQNSYFKIPKEALAGPVPTALFKPKSFLTFDDPLYQQLMTELMLNLEPRQEPAGTIIFPTNVETNEMFFLNSGAIDIGFELNNQAKYCIRLQKGTVVGAFNCTFNKKTMFIYKAPTLFRGYTIRKLNWLKILMNEDYHNLAAVIKKNVRDEYFIKIKNRVLLEQGKYVKRLQNRADYE
jgi:hypothetical protein